MRARGVSARTGGAETGGEDTLGERVIGAVLGRLAPKLSLRGVLTDGATVVVEGMACGMGVEGRIGCGAIVTFGWGENRGTAELPLGMGRAAGLAD